MDFQCPNGLGDSRNTSEDKIAIIQYEIPLETKNLGKIPTEPGVSEMTYNIRSDMNKRTAFHYCSYWGKWSRILSVKNGHFVELDLTPINSGIKENWRSLGNFNIRYHCTSPDKGDIFTHTLPEHILERLRENCSEEVVHNLLHYDFLPEIDWELYGKFCNGGAPFRKIQKKGI